MDYSHPLLLVTRRVGQKLGILRPVVSTYRKLFQPGYEAGFERAVMARIRPGDVVWDVGANVGYFTEKFACLVGRRGRVIAFEPASESRHLLRQRCSQAELTWVTAEAFALADFEGEASLHTSSQEADPTNGLAPREQATASTTVPVTTGEAYAESHSGCAPDCIKVDVEGFEIEVLRGLGPLLESSRLRALFVEVHFQILAQRGLAAAPARIVAMLSSAGFKIQWVDPSHLVALRQ
jgi:FkbM family methyltransferase